MDIANQVVPDESHIILEHVYQDIGCLLDVFMVKRNCEEHVFNKLGIVRIMGELLRVRQRVSDNLYRP